jgi:hypothetical protein
MPSAPQGRDYPDDDPAAATDQKLEIIPEMSESGEALK